MNTESYNLIEQTLAQALNEVRTEPVKGVGLVIEQFMATLSADNPNFNKLRTLNNIYAMIVNPRALDLVRTMIDNEMALLPAVREF